jgi:hypothetical protein
MDYKPGAGTSYFGGKVDANDAVYNQPPGTPEASVVGARYVADPGYHVTGSVDAKGIHLSIPLAELGLKRGDRVLNVTAFATAAPDASDPTAPTMVNSARTVDATPPFDAKVG